MALRFNIHKRVSQEEDENDDNMYARVALTRERFSLGFRPKKKKLPKRREREKFAARLASGAGGVQ